MADNNHAVIKIRTDQSANAIEDINHNFQVLTERIKDLNLTISYMDLLRLQEVYQVNLAQEESVRLQNFVSNCWGKLPNYSGVAFSTTGEGSLPLFEFLGNKVSTRDFLVKLPDDKCLYIQGVESKVFKPSYASNTLSYTLVDVDDAGSVDPIQLNIDPYVAASAVISRQYNDIAAGAAITPPTGYHVQASRWYTSNGEEVLWSGSHITDTNSSNMTLNAIIFFIR